MDIQLLFNGRRKICTTACKRNKFSELGKWINTIMTLQALAHMCTPPLPGSSSPQANPVVLINNNNECDSGNRRGRQWAGAGCRPRCLNIYVGLLKHMSSYFSGASTIDPDAVWLPWIPARGIWTQAPPSRFNVASLIQRPCPFSYPSHYSQKLKTHLLPEISLAAFTPENRFLLQLL